jgi:acyl phosphate:glycerol-3-phosphate acyltransferase
VWGLGFGAAAVAGHTWPVFLGFKGGKGVATSAGMLLAAAPAAVLAGLAVWVALFALTRYVSVASIGAAIAVPAAGWLLHGADGPARPAVLTALGALIVWKHRTNLARLRAGTEHRFVPKRRATGVGEGG